MPLSKGGRMAEKEPTVTVAVRLPLSQVRALRLYADGQSEFSRVTMSMVLREIIADWVADNV